jgi:hypothetical protein
MIRTKLGFKVLGLCALVFALMGLASSGAQAAATLVLEGSTVVEKGEVVLTTDVPGVLHSKISGSSVLFECPTISAVNANVLAGGTIGKETKEGKPVGASVKFSGCKTKLNGAEAAACEPNAGGTQPGVIVTSSGHAALVLNASKEELTQVLPDSGETFANIEMSKLCAIGTKVPVIGKLFLKDCENAFLIHQLKHLVEEGPGTELWTISKTEEHKATLLGSAWAEVFIGATARSFAGHAG